MMRKMFIVEKSPRLIWDAIEAQYGFGFLNKIIEEEYGISRNFQEKIKTEFNNELNIVKHSATDRINKVAS